VPAVPARRIERADAELAHVAERHRRGIESVEFYTPLKRNLKLRLVGMTWPPVPAHPPTDPSLNWRPPPSFYGTEVRFG
jgi:hypothetical protein